MGLRIAVLHETAADEARVAATPETVRKLIALGATLAVERGAGAAAGIADSDYEQAGAEVGERAQVLAGRRSCWRCRRRSGDAGRGGGRGLGRRSL